jgi:hypothetical protein
MHGLDGDAGLVGPEADDSVDQTESHVPFVGDSAENKSIGVNRTIELSKKSQNSNRY